MIDTQLRHELWSRGYWEIPDGLDTTYFDFSWRPDPNDPPMIHHFGTQWQTTGGPKFIIPESKGIVAMHNEQQAIKLDTEPKYYITTTLKDLINEHPNESFWAIHSNIDITGFDFSWHPDPLEKPYLHYFGTQWQLVGGPIYVVNGSTGFKICIDQQVKSLNDKLKYYITTTLDDLIKEHPNETFWAIHPNLNTSNFDFNWHPDPLEKPYLHQFGTQWQKTGGPIYVLPNNIGIKYQNCQTAIHNADHNNRCWRPLVPNYTIDFSWHPDDTEPPFIYVFYNQSHDLPTYQYRVPGATDKKYITTLKATLLPIKGHWEIPDGLNTSNFDFSWRPSLEEPAFIHQFGTQWQKTGGPRFVLPESEGIKYQNFQIAIYNSNHDNRCWRPLVSNCIIDFSWHPDDTEPPFIYIFYNQWYDLPTYQYRVPGATDKKYIANLKAYLLPEKERWEIPDDIDDSKFDFTWRPNPNEPPYIWQFGTQWQKTGGPKYIVEGATEVKYIDILTAIKLPNMRKWRIPEEIETDKFDFSWHPDDTEPPMMYEFGTQWQPAGGPVYVTTGSTQKKYCSDQIAIRIAKEDRCYRPVVSNMQFDYSWHPDPNEPPYIYVFGNQWYDAEVMPTLLYRVKDATEKKYVTNVKSRLTEKMDNWVTPDDVDFTVFDYSWCPHPGEPPLIHQFGTQWQRSGGPAYVAPNANGIKYESAIKSVKKPNIRNWRIIEPIDKDTFDFSWHPDSTEENYNHVFGTKFHTPEVLPALMYRGHDDARNNKYSDDLQADLQIEKVTYEDSIFDACRDHKFSTAYAHFIKSTENGNYIHDLIKNDNVSVHLFPSEAIVPRDAVQHMYDKLSDYDYVVNHKLDEATQPLDVIFFSNGEACAEENYKHLLSLGILNRIIRVDGVKGRVASQHAAANASNTPWYFLINAKLKVRENFNFNWQPNIHKSRRHYIFTATNPVNVLEYGHQAIVANNKKLTLNTVVRGLDFTMDSKTEVLSVNSGISTFNTSKWDAWRTAFREVIKLKHYTDNDSKHRLNAWLTIGKGEFGEYSIQGASDAVKYYDEVNGDMNKLMLTYDWEWLQARYPK